MGNQTGNKIKTIMTVKLFGSALLLLLSLHIGNAAPVNQRLSDAKLPPDEVNEAELDAYKDAALEFVKVFNDDLAKIAKEEKEEDEEEDEVTLPPFDDDDDDSDEDEDEDEPENEPFEPFGDEDIEKPAHLVLEVIDETRTTKSAIDDYEDEGDDEEVVEVIKVDPKKGSKHSDPHIVAIEDKNAGQDNDADNELLLAALAAEDKESEDDGEVIEVIKAEDHETEASSSDDKEVIEVVKVDPKKGSKHSDSHIVETILEKPVPEAKLKPTEKTAKRPSKPKEEVIEVIKAKDPETEDSSSDDNEEVIEVIKHINNPNSAELLSEDDKEVIEVIEAEDYETEDSSSDDDEELIEVVKVEPKVGSKPIVDPRIADIV